MLLNKGDKVSVVSPSSYLEKGSIDNGVKWLESLGLNVVLAPHVYDSFLYMAGSDESRAQDINAAFANKSIKAIFCSRGGAGSTRLLNRLDFDLIKQNPKPVFGLSDSTAFQNALFTKAGIVSYTGFLLAYDFKDNSLDEKTKNSVTNIFAEKGQSFQSGKTLNKGKTSGILVGGNLTVFCYLCGTEYFPDLTDKILLLEDIGEKTYKIDLMLNMLKQQKNFNKLKGIIFAKFTNCIEADENDGSTETIIKNFAKDLPIPVIYDFDYGHVKNKYVLPIGNCIELDADNSIIKI